MGQGKRRDEDIVRAPMPVRKIMPVNMGQTAYTCHFISGSHWEKPTLTGKIMCYRQGRMYTTEVV